MNVNITNNPIKWTLLGLSLAGLFTFFGYVAIGVLPVAALLFSLVNLRGLRSNVKRTLFILLPYTAGLLCFLMKTLYWDAVDFRHRTDNLLLLTLVFSILVAAHQYRVIKRFLYFFNRLSRKKKLLFIFLFAELFFILGSYMLVEKDVTMGGDEPHYLVISHSIARDLDLNVFNQYAREEYREFMDIRLSHHARVGKGFKRWFSYGHLPGLSVTLAPFFIFKIPHPLLYFLVRAYLGLFGAFMAVLVYLFAVKLWNHRNLALFITAVYTFTAPIFFFSIHVFSELQAGLLVLSSLYLLLMADKKTPIKDLSAGLLLGVSVFWGLKYNMFIFILTPLLFGYLFFKLKDKKRALLFALPVVLLQLLFFYYLYNAYGNFNLMSIYNGVMTEAQQAEYYSKVQKIPPLKRVETLLGIFFDQRDGLIPYNPFYLFFFPGLILAFRKFKKYLPYLLISGAGFAYILFMGYSTVRAGYCAQARYLVPAMWVLMLFAVIYRMESRNRLFRKLFYTLPLYSLAVMVYQMFYPFTLYQSATHHNLYRPGLMFQQWSSLPLDIPALLPSFVKVPGNFTYLPNLLFFASFIAFIILAQLNTKGKSIRLWFVPPALFILAVFVFALFPRVPDYNPVLLTKTEGLPCKVYGKSFYPTRAEERNFPLQRKQLHTFTLSTLQPAAGFLLKAENLDDRDYRLTVSNFDTPIQQEWLLSPGTRELRLSQPRHRKHGNTYFYRFHIRVTPAPPRKPVLYIQLSPVKK